MEKEENSGRKEKHTIRISSKLYEQLDKIVSEKGLTITEAIDFMFREQKEEKEKSKSEIESLSKKVESLSAALKEKNKIESLPKPIEYIKIEPITQEIEEIKEAIIEKQSIQQETLTEKLCPKCKCFHHTRPINSEAEAIAEEKQIQEEIRSGNRCPTCHCLLEVIKDETETIELFVKCPFHGIMVRSYSENGEPIFESHEREREGLPSKEERERIDLILNEVTNYCPNCGLRTESLGSGIYNCRNHGHLILTHSKNEKPHLEKEVK